LTKEVTIAQLIQSHFSTNPQILIAQLLEFHYDKNWDYFVIFNMILCGEQFQTTCQDSLWTPR